MYWMNIKYIEKMKFDILKYVVYFIYIKLYIDIKS